MNKKAARSLLARLGVVKMNPECFDEDVLMDVAYNRADKQVCKNVEAHLVACSHCRNIVEAERASEAHYNLRTPQCPSVEVIDSYLLGEESGEIEAHVRECPFCRWEAIKHSRAHINQYKGELKNLRVKK